MRLCLQVLRGGWEGGKPGYKLSYQTATSNGSKVEHVPFSGLDDELTAFIHQVPWILLLFYLLKDAEC